MIDAHPDLLFGEALLLESCLAATDADVVGVQIQCLQRTELALTQKLCQLIPGSKADF